MKKLLLAAIAVFAFAGGNLLPQTFGVCAQTGAFTQNNPPIPLNDHMKIVKKYDCKKNILYIGVEDEIPGILKLNVNNDTKDFLLKHFTLQGFKAAVYVDKNLKTGVIAVQLTPKYALKIIFNATNYESVINELNSLNIKKIKEQLS
jgi:hypothetical protein